MELIPIQREPLSRDSQNLQELMRINNETNPSEDIELRREQANLRIQLEVAISTLDRLYKEPINEEIAQQVQALNFQIQELKKAINQ